VTLNELRQCLREAELIPESAPPVAPQPPWYLRAISGCGAWLACLFLLGFWAVISRGEHGALGLGLLHCGIGAALAFRGQGSRSVSALSNLALSLWLTGLVLVVVGLFDTLRGAGGSAVVALTLALTSLLYPEWLGRFLTLLVSGCFAVHGVCAAETVYWLDLFVILLPFLAGVTWLGQGWLWLRGWGSWTSAWGYAALVTLWMVLGVSYWEWVRAEISLAGRLSLIAMVLWLVARILYRLKPPPLAAAWGLGGTFVVAGLTHNFPGILAGLGILLLGFEVGNPGLIVMAGLYWVHFWPAYFYDLEISLTLKAVVMGSTGLVLLGLRHTLLRAAVPAESESGGAAPSA